MSMNYQYPVSFLDNEFLVSTSVFVKINSYPRWIRIGGFDGDIIVRVFFYDRGYINALQFENLLSDLSPLT
jgi:hypothetical protein